VRSYIDQHENGLPGWDGIAWDYILLVNPPIDGEKVYIPEEQSHGHGPSHWFYIDTLVRADGPVYRIKPGAQPWVEKDQHGLEVEQDQTWKSPSNGFLFAPVIASNGCSRVYVNDFESSDAKRYFQRSDLVLLNPAPARSGQ
jgi:hypothetical protein